MDNELLEENIQTSTKGISPKIFILSLSGMMVLSSLVTATATYYLWEKGEERYIPEETASESRIIPSEISPTSAVILSTLESNECGIAFDYPSDWTVMHSDDENSSCYYQVAVNEDPLRSFLLESSGAFEGSWEATLKKMTDQLKDHEEAKNGNIEVETVSFLGNTALKQTTYGYKESTAQVPVTQIMFAKGRNTFQLQYVEQGDSYNVQIEQILTSVRFTKPDIFYQKELQNRMSVSLKKNLEKSEAAAIRSKIITIKNSLEQYYKDNTSYPRSLSELIPGFLAELPSEIELVYDSDSQTYTLSTTLPSGEQYAVTSP